MEPPRTALDCNPLVLCRAHGRRALGTCSLPGRCRWAGILAAAAFCRGRDSLLPERSRWWVAALARACRAGRAVRAEKCWRAYGVRLRPGALAVGHDQLSTTGWQRAVADPDARRLRPALRTGRPWPTSAGRGLFPLSPAGGRRALLLLHRRLGGSHRLGAEDRPRQWRNQRPGRW